MFHFISKNSDDPFSHRPQIVGFSVLFPNFPQQNLLFLPSFLLFPLNLYSSLKNTLSSLHIFVHHCTFCASLHVKTFTFLPKDFLPHFFDPNSEKKVSFHL